MIGSNKTAPSFFHETTFPFISFYIKQNLTKIILPFIVNMTIRFENSNFCDSRSTNDVLVGRREYNEANELYNRRLLLDISLVTVLHPMILRTVLHAMGAISRALRCHELILCPFLVRLGFSSYAYFRGK